MVGKVGFAVFAAVDLAAVKISVVLETHGFVRVMTRWLVVVLVGVVTVLLLMLTLLLGVVVTGRFPDSGDNDVSKRSEQSDQLQSSFVPTRSRKQPEPTRRKQRRSFDDESLGFCICTTRMEGHVGELRLAGTRRSESER